MFPIPILDIHHQVRTRTNKATITINQQPNNFFLQTDKSRGQCQAKMLFVFVAVVFKLAKSSSQTWQKCRIFYVTLSYTFLLLVFLGT